MKLGIAIALAAAAAAFLLVAASGARERGKNTYCRNNLRKLGQMAFQKLESEDAIEGTGRNFWQAIRVEFYTNTKGKWVMPPGGANSFACPVRGVQPLDLSLLSAEELERHMSDPSTIDYRGPRLAAGLSSVTPYILAADFARNHPGGGGHVLLVDHTVRDIHAAVRVKDFSSEPRAAESLSE